MAERKQAHDHLVSWESLSTMQSFAERLESIRNAKATSKARSTTSWHECLHPFHANEDVFTTTSNGFVATPDTWCAFRGNVKSINPKGMQLAKADGTAVPHGWSGRTLALLGAVGCRLYWLNLPDEVRAVVHIPPAPGKLGDGYVTSNGGRGSYGAQNVTMADAIDALWKDVKTAAQIRELVEALDCPPLSAALANTYADLAKAGPFNIAIRAK